MRSRGSLRSSVALAFLAAVLVAVGGVGVLAVLAADPANRVPLAAGLGGIAVAAVFLAWIVASSVTRPIERISRAAAAALRGEALRPVEAEGPEEVSALASAMNQMRARLEASVAELEVSRDEIRRSVRRLGETLRATHDMTRLLSVVLDTASVSVQARSGIVYLLTARRDGLYVKVARNLDRSYASLRIPVGTGVAGHVAEHRTPIVVAPGLGGPVFDGSEPPADTAIAVPLDTTRQPIGVMVLYGRETEMPFGVEDLELIGSLARQASVGIENVLLHQEAERLSITDGVTGVWNHRYFDMRLSQEVERAIRFQHGLSLLVVDIDHFKMINDRHGHQRGNEVLIELAQRIVRGIRSQVDTLARYGGDEFVLILPETPVDGAHIVGQKLCESIGREPFAGEGQDPVLVSVSVGVACLPQHGTTAQALLQSADRAMYVAKTRGRNRVVTADEAYDMPPGVAHGQALAGEPQRP